MNLGAEKTSRPPRVLVAFDGKCVLCNGWVRWLAARDPEGRLLFAPLQGRTVERLREAKLPIPDDLRGVVVVEPRGRVLVGAAAVVRLLAYLPWPWRALAVLATLPPSPLQLLYDWVARNRYRWFGTTSQLCELIPPHIRSRLLD